MSPQAYEALQLLSQATALLQTNRETHIKIAQAIDLIKSELEAAAAKEK